MHYDIETKKYWFHLYNSGLFYAELGVSCNKSKEYLYMIDTIIDAKNETNAIWSYLRYLMVNIDLFFWI